MLIFAPKRSQRSLCKSPDRRCCGAAVARAPACGVGGGAQADLAESACTQEEELMQICWELSVSGGASTVMAVETTGAVLLQVAVAVPSSAPGDRASGLNCGEGAPMVEPMARPPPKDCQVGVSGTNPCCNCNSPSLANTERSKNTVGTSAAGRARCGPPLLGDATALETHLFWGEPGPGDWRRLAGDVMVPDACRPDGEMQRCAWAPCGERRCPGRAAPAESPSKVGLPSCAAPTLSPIQAALGSGKRCLLDVAAAPFGAIRTS